MNQQVYHPCPLDRTNLEEVKNLREEMEGPFRLCRIYRCPACRSVVYVYPYKEIHDYYRDRLKG